MDVIYEAMMIAATGLTNQQRRIDVIANNVANVNSAGYKSSRLDFKDALYTAGIVPGPPRTPSPEGNQQKGHGVMVAGITKNHTTGTVQRTDRDLDIAIIGEGYLELEDLNGDLLYTRNGNLHLDDDGYLVNSDGQFFLNTNGGRIQAPYGTHTIEFNEKGVVTFIADGYEASSALGLYTFRNVTGLASSGMGTYRESPASGEKRPAGNALVKQGMIEISNVNLAEEMTRLIRTQRTFQLASRALTTADQMEGIANSLRK